jgi:GTPase SAR1 family protein
METSAKTGTNVNDIFVAIAKKLPKEQPRASNSNNRVELTNDQANKGGCC